ncbi:MAG: phytanoyl-CoA dioxygenase family protein [Deltaproteobacteria bacterium]|nr:phytanoyl-CoA dioxygenase family protein [Deltaproteobacteria bacterium]
MNILTESELKFWKENGYLLLRDFVSPAEQKTLGTWTKELANLPETPGKWMKYFEKSVTGHDKRMLCRLENFIPYHAGFNEFLNDARKLAILSQLMEEPAILFKEKINFKLPGGKGFTRHQDAPAFTTFGQTYHITMMVALDAATVENGCLEVVKGHHKKGTLPQAPDGTIRQDVIDSLRWEPITMNPGDFLFFDSYLPHGSASNRSAAPRRALYVTYNKESEGSRREAYFAHKRDTFPPECERVPGVDYMSKAGVYNLGNPID